MMAPLICWYYSDAQDANQSWRFTVEHLIISALIASNIPPAEIMALWQYITTERWDTTDPLD